MRRWLAIAFALVLGAPAWAADEVRQQVLLVETALNRLVQEQQAVYQQFQMVQEMRRNEERLALQRLPVYRLGSSPPPSFDDLQRDEAARQQRLDQLHSEGERLYARYRELEEQKRPLLDTLGSLALTPPAPAAASAAAPPAAPARPLPQ